MRLRIPTAELDRLRAAAQAGYPHETCGLLIGRHTDGVVEVTGVRQGRNLNTERAHDRYELDPLDILAAENAAREAAQQVVGVWHSHPDHPARPSQTDLEAAWQDWSYLILSVARDRVGEIRSWRLDEAGRFIEEMIET
jgi:proteasome lid subunit RPN8/RPN11